MVNLLETTSISGGFASSPLHEFHVGSLYINLYEQNIPTNSPDVEFLRPVFDQYLMISSNIG